MDYEKEYKKLKASIRGEYLYAQTDSTKAVLESILPELKEKEKENEDDRIRKAISQCVEDMRGQFEKLYRVHHKDALAWLEKQKPTEWGEEDEKFYKTALWHISFSVSNGKSTDCRCDTTEWFKSLKGRMQSQNKWKPSDEQLHYLSWIANIKLGDSMVEQDVSKHLNELLEDLKKLKEN